MQVLFTLSSQMWWLGWHAPSQVSRGGSAHLWSGAVPRFLPGWICSRTLTLQRPLSQNPKKWLLGLKSCETAKTPLTSWCEEVPAPPWGLLPAWQFRKKAAQWALPAHYSPLRGNQRECLSSYYSIVQFYGGLPLNIDVVKEAKNLI